MFALKAQKGVKTPFFFFFQLARVSMTKLSSSLFQTKRTSHFFLLTVAFSQIFNEQYILFLSFQCVLNIEEETNQTFAVS